MRLIPPGGGHGVAVSIIGTIGFLNKSAKAISLFIKKSNLIIFCYLKSLNLFNTDYRNEIQQILELCKLL
jgi:hypothetical protein